MIVCAINKEVTMGRHQSIITESIFARAKLALKQMQEVNSRESTRLKAIISAWNHGITLASKILEISPKTIREWAKRFSLEGIKGLRYKPGRGRRPHVDTSKRVIIKGWLKKDPSTTLKELVIKVKDNFDVTTSISALHRTLKKLGVAYITPRPIHYKQNKKDRNEFKKKSICIT